MGRESCSIQHPVLKIEADANFKVMIDKDNRKPDVTFIERQNMKKKAQSKSNNKLNLNRKDVPMAILRKTGVKNVVVASALTLALVVGNQSTLEF